MLRSILGVILGILGGGAVVALVERLGHALHPVPAGVDLSDRVNLAAHVQAAPLAALLAVVLAWFLGGLTGGALTGLVTKRSRAVFVTCGVLFAFTALTLVMIPHPWWMWALGLGVYFPAACFALRLTGAGHAATVTPA